MKKLFSTLALILALTFHAPALAIIGFVQGGGTRSSGPVAELGYPIGTVTAGNFLAACGMCFDNNCNGNVWSSSPSNTWASAIDSSDSANIGYAMNVASGSTTITLTPAASTYLVVGAAEFSGVKTSAALDQTNVAIGHDGFVDTQDIITTGTSVLLGCLEFTAEATVTEDAAWNLIHEDETYIATSGSFIYRIAASGTYHASWTFGLAPGTVDASIANFLEAPAGGGPAAGPFRRRSQ